MKKLKIALAALGFVVAIGSAVSSQAKQAPAPCTPEQIVQCTGDDAYCCDGPDGNTRLYVFAEQ